MVVLVSAADCSPYVGSDSYLGWNYTLALANLCHVIVLTDSCNRKDIERWYGEHKNIHVNIEYKYIDSVNFIRKYHLGLNEQFCVLETYYLWEKSAYRYSKHLVKKRKIDVIHHLTLSGYRIIGDLWRLNIPFLFGPCGGGQETPECLKSYVPIREQKSEKLRHIINQVAPKIPNYRRAIRKTEAVFCVNKETFDILKKNTPIENQKKIHILSDLAISEHYISERENLVKRNWNNQGKVQIIVSGRLIARKGVSLLIDAIEKINTNVPYSIEIYGDGEERRSLEQKTQKSHLKDRIFFHGAIEYEAMQEIYKEGDILALPSLRESAGTSVYEAMANKMPVVALNQGGAKYLIEDDAGILVNVEDKEQVIEDFSRALQRLIENPNLRKKLGENGFNKIKTHYCWNERVKFFYDIYSKITK